MLGRRTAAVPSVEGELATVAPVVATGLLELVTRHGHDYFASLSLKSGSNIYNKISHSCQEGRVFDILQYMRLSLLQKHILRVCFQAKGKVPRAPFHAFYEGKSARPKDIVDTITKTLERMIDKGLLVGLGVRTPKRWYIKEVRLTPLGRRTAKKFQGEQQHLPFGIKQYKRDKD